MKRLLTLLLILAVVHVLAADAPEKVTGKNNAGTDLTSTGVTVSDGHSSYTFYPSGDFDSGPLGMSGRTLKGTWKFIEHDAGTATKVEVIAMQGWMNGLSGNDDWRRIVFCIWPGKVIDSKKQPEGPRLELWLPSNYTGYWLIDEMSKTQKPEAAK